MKGKSRKAQPRPTGTRAVLARKPSRPAVPPAERRPPVVNGTLPAGYGETRVVLLPVDPYLVHAYWEVSEKDSARIRGLAEQGSTPLQAVLRFHDITSAPLGGLRAAESFDVEIQIDVPNWYVRLLSPEKSYIVDLGLRGKDGRFHRIARSNPAGTPRAWPCRDEGKQLMRVVEHEGLVSVEHPVEGQNVSDTVPAAGDAGQEPLPPPREEGHRAVAGLPFVGAPAAGAEQIFGDKPAPRPSEAVERGSPERRGEESRPEKAQRALPVRGNVEEAGPVLPIQKTGANDTAERFGKRPAATAERPNRPVLSPDGGVAARSERPPGPQEGAVAVDLSLWCEHLFVSGLSSAHFARAGEGDGRD